MNVIRLIGSTVGALVIALVMSTSAAQAQTVSADGPYCPNSAPLTGRYIGSTVSEGRYYDIYLVPFFLGYQTQRVACP